MMVVLSIEEGMCKIETQELACPLFVTVHTLGVSNPQEKRLVTRTASFVITIYATHYSTCGFVEIFAADLAGHVWFIVFFPEGVMLYGISKKRQSILCMFVLNE
jgi:hypothetical protein